MTRKTGFWEGITPFPFFLICLLSPMAAVTSTTEFRTSKNSDAGVVVNPYVSVEDYQLLRQYPVERLMSLIHLVSAEFPVIVVPILEANPDQAVSLYMLPLAVAKYNAEMASLGSPSEVGVWIYTNLSQHSTHLNATIDEFRFIRILANTTDAIFEETVSSMSIFLSPTELLWTNLTDTFSKLETMFPRPVWNLGISLDPVEFQQAMVNNTKNLTTAIQTLFPFLDHVVFAFSEVDDDLHYNQSVASVLSEIIELASSCRRFVHENINRSISYLVKIGWPDTTQQGRVNYTRSVEFWETMSALARDAGLSVIFENAFDQCFGNDPRETTSGWWRLVESSAYSNASQYVFETKKDVALREEERTIYSWMSRINKTVKFDKSRVSVKFNPYVLQSHADNPDSFNRSLVPVLLNKMATQFGSLVVGHDDLDSHDGIENATLPEAVAKFNLNATFPLRLTMSLEMDMENETDSIIELIFKTNRAYPGTVTKVLTFGHFTNRSVPELRKRLNPEGSETEILVGIQLPIEFCAGSEIDFLHPSDVPMTTLLSSADFVYFSYLPGEEGQPSYVFGVDRILTQVKTRFENCKHRVALHLPKLEVGFETGYSDSINSVVEDYLSLAVFWGEMNEWSQKTNISVTFSDVFDVPFQGQREANKLFAHLGWWKVLQDPEDPHKLLFLNKRQAALKELQDTIPPVATGNMRRYELLYSITILIIFIVLVAALVYFPCKGYVEKKRKDSPTISLSRTYTALQPVPSEDDVRVLAPTDFCQNTSTNILGTGRYTLIYKCPMSIFEKDVAVKIARAEDAACRDTILSEIRTLRHVGSHENILPLLGMSREGATPYLVIEYCAQGTLRRYLNTLIGEDRPSHSDLAEHCWEIANGMTFLAEKNVILGDLSAKNVFVTAERKCKIANLGSSLDLEQYKTTREKNDSLPWRWMASEALIEAQFSLKSDVWSMGVTFWEVFSLGAQPFPEMTWDVVFNTQVQEGMRLVRPMLTPENIYRVVESCWEGEPTERPTAAGIRQALLPFREQAVAETAQ